MQDKTQALHDAVEQFLAALQQQQQRYSVLLALAQEKKDVIIRNDVNRLGEIIREEDQALSSIFEINDRTLVHQNEIAALTDRETIEDLRGVIGATQDARQKAALEELHKQFAELVDALQTANDINQKLIETQIQYGEFCIELMTQEESVGDFYGNTGRVGDTPATGRGFINRKV